MIANFVNLCLCFAWGMAALCRLSQMHANVSLRAGVLYVILFVGSALSGLQFFFFGTLAGWADVAVSGMVCLLLAITVPEWRNGPPRHTLRV